MEVFFMKYVSVVGLVIPLLLVGKSPLQAQLEVDRVMQEGDETNHQADIRKFEQIYDRALRDEDTLQMIEGLLGMGETHSRLLQFSEAIDEISEADYLAQQVADTIQWVEAKVQMSRIMRSFRKDSVAYDLVNQAHDLVVRRGGVYARHKLPGIYFELAVLNRTMGRVEETQKYLDRFEAIENGDPESYYFRLEKARLLLLQGDEYGAQALLLDLEMELTEAQTSGTVSMPQASSIIFVYSHLGHLYDDQGDMSKAISYYTMAIHEIDRLQHHIGHQQYLYNYRGRLYYQLGQHQKAYDDLVRSREISETFFGAKSGLNRGFFDLRNRYQERLEAQEQVMAQQQLLLAKRETTILWFRAIVAVLVLFFVVLALWMRNRKQKAKHRKEKELLLQKREEETKRIAQVLEYKNKELTTYTLKLVEKEELIAEAVAFAQKYRDSEGARYLIRKLKQSADDSWEEFHKRFQDVYSGFYDRLIEKYGDLSPNELKLCSLIRLNFSVKETAQLLGISPTSVNMARYRLRTKLALDREVNLHSFMTQV
ncbi:hypothetical protein BGP76_00750 [Reichenbachiella sp. MSK19-1]|nr:hypothetical protein BGP76_00750 [Reichenbachiella sp. MSK19-1]